MVITNQQIKEIEERLGKVPVGPWSHIKGDSGYEAVLTGQIEEETGDFGAVLSRYAVELHSTDGGCQMESDDWEFLAHARQDIPALIAEIRRMRLLLIEFLPFESFLRE